MVKANDEWSHTLYEKDKDFQEKRGLNYDPIANPKQWKIGYAMSTHASSRIGISPQDHPAFKTILDDLMM